MLPLELGVALLLKLPVAEAVREEEGVRELLALAVGEPVIVLLPDDVPEGVPLPLLLPVELPDGLAEAAQVGVALSAAKAEGGTCSTMGAVELTLPSTVLQRVALYSVLRMDTVARLMRSGTAPLGHTTTEPMGASRLAEKLPQGRASSVRKKSLSRPLSAFWQPLKAWSLPKTRLEEQGPPMASLLGPLPSGAVKAPSSPSSTWG